MANVKTNMASCYDDVLLVFDGCVHFPPYLSFPPSLFFADRGAEWRYLLVALFAYRAPRPYPTSELEFQSTYLGAE